MVTYCAAYGCMNHSKSHPSVRFHRFPKDVSKCKLWIKNIGREDLFKQDLNALNAKYRICGIHFDDAHKRSNGLAFNAIPNKCLLPPGSSKIEQCSKSTQTEPILIHTTATQTCSSVMTDAMIQTALYLSKSTPRKRKLQQS